MPDYTPTIWLPGVDATPDRLNNMEEGIDGANQAIDDALPDITAAQAAAAAAQAAADQAQAAADAAAAAAATAQGEVDALETTVAGHETRLDDAEPAIVAAQAAADAAQAAADAAAAAAAAAQADADAAQAAADALDTRMDTAEGTLTSLDGRLDTAESSLTSLDGRLDAAEPQLVSLDGRLDTIEPQVADHETRLDAAEPQLVSLDSRLDTAEADILAADRLANHDVPAFGASQSGYGLVYNDATGDWEPELLLSVLSYVSGLTDQATKDEQMLARPVSWLQGQGTFTTLHAAGVFHMFLPNGGIFAAPGDTQTPPIGLYLDPTQFDTITNYKPQFRIRATFNTFTTDPGAQTFTCGLTEILGTSGGAANNGRWTLSGTYSSAATTNMAANAVAHVNGGWVDLQGTTARIYSAYIHASGALAANAQLHVRWVIEMRWVPDPPIP